MGDILGGDVEDDFEPIKLENDLNENVLAEDREDKVETTKAAKKEKKEESKEEVKVENKDKEEIKIEDNSLDNIIIPTDIGKESDITSPDIKLDELSNLQGRTKTETQEIVKKEKKSYANNELSAMLSKDKKIVSFIGTSKNGTSFLINSLAMLFSSIGINTAILDMTTNRNSYYMCTNNDERLRKIAVDSIDNLQNDVAMGVQVSKYMTIYTALPGNNVRYTDAGKILSTLAKNYSLVLIDTDFNTDHSFFALSQEIYLVQSLDILTIQPLTSFLKELLDEGILTNDKVKVVINKEMAVKGLTKKILVGGLSTYNNPSMSIMTNLFDRNTVPVCSIPFDQVVYSKYLENVIACRYDISGYPKRFVDTLKVLANMVYPLISRQTDVGITDTTFTPRNEF